MAEKDVDPGICSIDRAVPGAFLDPLDVGLIVCDNPITARKAAETLRQETLRQITERVIDQSCDAVSIIGRDYRYRLVNPVFTDRLALPAARILGRHVAEVLGRQNFEEVIRPYFDRCLAGEDVEYELPYDLPRLGLRWLEVRYLPLRGDDGGIDAVVVVSRDVTERHLAGERLRQARDEAERANAAKSRFLAAASHDLRQPLQSMFLFAASLAPYVGEGEGREKLTLLERGLDTLKGLLDGLFNLSRLEADVMEPEIAPLPLRELVDEVAAFYAPIAASKGVAFTVDPGCACEVLSDRILLGRMLRNLAENAIRFTERGRVSIACRRGERSLRIEVSDTGIGIPPEHLERVFEEFHQVGNQERDRGQGLGLGLAIVRRLSTLLEHPVDVRSAPGQGSTFAITVPLTSRPGAPAGPAPAPVKADGAGRLAVLVDDDAIVLLGLRAIFEEWGYATLIAGSAEQAVEGLRARDAVPDILVSDYRLRGGRVGTEAIRMIREQCGHAVPGIILTGETGAECEQDAAGHGLDIVHKPVTPRQLKAALARLIPGA